MNSVFDKLDQFIAAVKAKAADATTLAGNVFDELAAWCRNQTAVLSGVSQAPHPIDAGRLAAAKTGLAECRKALAVPAGAGAAFSGAGLLKILSLIEAVVAAL